MTHARRRPAALLFAFALATGAAGASTLNVAVSDAAGKPLAGAVAFLEPAAGKLAVKPLPVVDVAQSKRQFTPRVSVITVGTPVNFPNLDTVRHHVFSFSPSKTFEIRLYAGVPSAPVVFDKPGFAVLGCNIHDQMAAWIAVLDTPFYALSAANGRARVDGVPAGAYRLHVWHPGLGAGDEAPALAVTVGSADAEQSVRLRVVNNPLVAEP